MEIRIEGKHATLLRIRFPQDSLPVIAMRYPRMNASTRPVLLTSCAALGFAAVFFGQRLMAPTPPPALDAPIPASTPVLSGKTTAQPAPAGPQVPPDLLALSKATGPALVGQLEAAFRLLGLDPAWAAALAADSASGFPALLEKMKTLPGNQKSILTGFLLDRWALLDPLGGAEFFKKQDDEENLSALLRQWGLIDFPAAAAKAGAYGEKSLRRTLREKAKVDPAGFLTWVKDHPDINPLTIFKSGEPANVEALQQLTQLDPDRMLEWSKQVPEKEWTNGFAESFAAALAKKTPDAAIAWANALTDPSRVCGALAGIAETLADTDPARALTLASGLQDTGFQQIDLFGKIITKLGYDDPDKAAAALETLPKGALRSQLIGKTLSSLLKTDPARAFAMADRMGAEDGNMGGMGPDAMPRSPEEARRLFDLAAKAGDSSFRKNAVAIALFGWLQKDPASLGTYLNGKMDGPLFSAMKSDIQNGLAMMALQTGQPLAPELVAAIGMKPEFTVAALVQKSPEQAAAQLDSITDPAAKTRVLRDVANAWAERDRNEAIDWAGTLTTPQEQATAWQTITKSWLAEDSHKASQWVNTLPPGEARDTAAQTIAQSMSDKDPDLSWPWTLSMTTPELRVKTMNEVALKWSRQNPAGLQAALADPAITPDERLAVLKHLKESASP
jgi:hypothetical protein